MKLIWKKMKAWAARIAFIAAGLAAGVLGTALWERISREREKGEKEERSAEDFEREDRDFERRKEVVRRAEEEVRALPDADLDRRYPSLPRDARQGGDRFVARCRGYLLSRRGDGYRGESDPDRSGGD